jgi:3-dehydroquinate dehydratase
MNIQTLLIDIEHNVAIEVNNNKNEKTARTTEAIHDSHNFHETSLKLQYIIGAIKMQTMQNNVISVSTTANLTQVILILVIGFEVIINSVPFSI